MTGQCDLTKAHIQQSRYFSFNDDANVYFFKDNFNFEIASNDIGTLFENSSGLVNVKKRVKDPTCKELVIPTIGFTSFILSMKRSISVT